LNKELLYEIIVLRECLT